MNKEFLNFVEELIKANPDLATKLRTPNVDIYLENLRNEPEKPAVTESGRVILKILQADFATISFKASDIAYAVGALESAPIAASPRAISGALRKLVNDGFCDKIGKDPITYTLTEKGKNFIID